MSEPARAAGATDETGALLDGLEALFRTRRAADAELERILPAARERGESLAHSAGGTGEAATLAAMAFAAEVLSGLWVERAWTRAQVAQLVERIATLLELPAELAAVRLYLRAAREQQLLELPPKLAIETQLRMLRAFAPVEQASLWTTAPDTGITCIVHVGDAGAGTSREARDVARALLDGDAAGAADGTTLHGVRVTRWQRTVAALVVDADPARSDEALALAHEAAGTIAPLLEVDQLLDRNAARERALVESTERQLVRLGFDLHDGALQDLAALASDLRLFRSQLAEVLGDVPQRDLVLGRIDDLEGRVVSMDAELRELSQSLESPGAIVRPLPEAVEAEVRKFGRSTGILPGFEVRGSFDDLTASQTIALSRIVQEALQNVQEHAGATEVQVSLAATRTTLEAQVVDDGRGFDVDERLVAAARGGRLGLVGMAERVRLLGGRFEIDSRPGGPTRVTARIPRWRPTTPRADGIGPAPA